MFLINFHEIMECLGQNFYKTEYKFNWATYDHHKKFQYYYASVCFHSADFLEHFEVVIDCNVEDFGNIDIADIDSDVVVDVVSVVDLLDNAAVCLF